MASFSSPLVKLSLTINLQLKSFCIHNKKKPSTLKKNCFVTRIFVSDFLVCNKNPRKTSNAMTKNTCSLLQLKFVTANFGPYVNYQH